MQAIVPLITCDGPILYFMVAVFAQMTPGPISALVETSTSSITLFNPLLIIICIRCYRQTVFGMFKRRDRARVRYSTTSGASGGAVEPTLYPQLSRVEPN
ncbi:hypothetical protein AAVH_28307 [Aphelenchoides avenae]|nr:hypothetical protein AAVH_28307 [Aphelenchus avenae]